MFTHLDESLKRLLLQNGGFDPSDVDISFDMPTREWAAGISKPTINLYLYDIRENREIRDRRDWESFTREGNSAVMKRPGVWMNVSYNITVHATTIEDEHLLLSNVVLALLRFPVLPEDVLDKELEGREIPTFVGQSDGIIQSPADYWGSLDNDIRPSLDYRAVLKLEVEPNRQQVDKLVFTSRFDVGSKENGDQRIVSRDSPHLYRIWGTVHKAGEINVGIRDLKVTIREKGMDYITDGHGRYVFKGLQEGTYTLVVTDQAGNERANRSINVPLESVSESYDVGI